MALNLHHLAVLEAVADCQNVTAAAGRLMISQPAVTKQVKLLEASLGAKLIERSQRGVTLTEAGRELAVYARRISALSREAEQTVADLRSLRGGRLAVGASPMIGTHLLPQLLVRYRLKYPGVRLQYEVAQASSLFHRLLNDEIEVGLTEVEPATEALSYHVFARDEMVPISAPGHAILRRKAIALREFVAAGLVLHDAGSPGGSFVEQMLRQEGITPQPAFRLNSTEAIKEAIAAGLGVGLVSRMSVQNELQMGRLKMVKVKGPVVRRPLYRVTRRGLSESKTMTAFLYMLKHAVRGTLPSLDRPIVPAI